MAHELEIVDGQAQMAYVGQVPWHGLGKQVPPDLTPEQMLEAAGLDWEVEKVPAYAVVNGIHVPVDRCALVRKSDWKVLDIVSTDWNEVQNLEAFQFFADFVAAGDMEMETAGSLKGGQIVWGLARVKESFELFGGDKVDSYLHFTNFHRYGCSTDICFDPIRTVCMNTLRLTLNATIERRVKVSHRHKFEPDLVKEALGIAKDKLAQYKEMAAFLGSKRAKDEDVVEYLSRVFCSEGPKLSRNGENVWCLITDQPGAEYAEGTWWQPYNAVSYFVDHKAGRTTDSRLTSAWYGSNRTLKTKALELAVEMAEKS